MWLVVHHMTWEEQPWDVSEPLGTGRLSLAQPYFDDSPASHLSARHPLPFSIPKYFPAFFPQSCHVAWFLPALSDAIRDLHTEMYWSLESGFCLTCCDFSIGSLQGRTQRLSGKVTSFATPWPSYWAQWRQGAPDVLGAHGHSHGLFERLRDSLSTPLCHFT
jgi:hypothetical protein